MRSFAKKLHVSKKITRSVHEDIRYKTYIMKRGQFIFEKSKENNLNRYKRLLNKLKNPAEARMVICTTILPLNIWPPNSPDLNPLDYFVWSVVEKEVNELQMK